MAEAEKNMKKLRIALTTGNYNHIADGVSLTLNRLVGYLLERGHEVKIFAPTRSPAAIAHNGELHPVRAVSIPKRKEYMFSCGLGDASRETLRMFKPDLIHVATPDITGCQSLLYGLRKKIPVVASYHTHFTSYFSYYNIECIEPAVWSYLRWFYSRVEHTYVPSQSMIDTLTDQGFAQNMRIWSRGIDLQRFNPGRRSLQWRQSKGVADDEVLVTMVSRLVWEKEMDTLRKTYELLHRRYPNVKTMVVGDGPALQEMQESMPETYFTGHLQGNDLATAYASSDVFVFPSISETFGNVTLEALASGVPAVVANAQGNKSLVRHGKHGFLVTPKQPESFASAIGTLITQHELRSEFADNACEFARQFTWENILSGLENDYFTAINAYQPR